MEFEEMQLIWNDQKEERMFAIDETALHATIRRKGEAVGRKVGLLEWMMIGVNMVVALVLLGDAYRDGAATYQYLIAGVYFAYGIFALIRRLLRRRELVQFDDSLRGDLDRAIWQVEYLIRNSRGLVLWYLGPLLLVIAIGVYVGNGALWGLWLLLLLAPVTYFASRWEINRFYVPKKRELEALRQKLLAADS